MNRKWNFVRFIALIIAQINPKSAVSNTASLTSNKPRNPMVQTFNINNWGFEDADRKILSEIKYKVDYLYEKSGKSFSCIRSTQRQFFPIYIENTF